MTQTLEARPADVPAGTDLVAEVQRVLAASTEPLTLSKIRAQLPAPLRAITVEELTDCLQRQVAANVWFQYPKYRSQQDRYWDRSMRVHVALLLRETLQAEPLPLSVLRRKLPAYAQAQVEPVLQEQLSQGLLYRHPRIGTRGGDRFAARPADPKDYLRAKLAAAFRDLEQLGFSQSQLRAGALELLHEEEWASPASTPAPASAPAEEETGVHAESTPATTAAAPASSPPSVAAPAPAQAPNPQPPPEGEAAASTGPANMPPVNEGAETRPEAVEMGSNR
jgi:hypothetical protein